MNPLPPGSEPTPTPETDSVEWSPYRFGTMTKVVDAEFARKLERELSAVSHILIPLEGETLADAALAIIKQREANAERAETAEARAAKDAIERCAKVCDDIMEMNQHSAYRGARLCAERIRAMSVAPKEK